MRRFLFLLSNAAGFTIGGVFYFHSFTSFLPKFLSIFKNGITASVGMAHIITKIKKWL